MELCDTTTSLIPRGSAARANTTATGCRVSAPRTLVIIGDLTLSAASALGLEP
jgi:hypothetical protein